MNEISPPASWPGPEPHEAPESYHIEATKSLVDRTLRTLKHDDLFGVFDKQGDCRGGEDGPDGLFYQDTRFLSGLTLRIGGMEPLLLGSVVLDDNDALVVDLANADLHDRRRQGLAAARLDLRRADQVPLRPRLLRTDQGPALQPGGTADPARNRVRCRLRRSVRGARRPAAAARDADGRDGRRPERALRLSRPRRHRAHHRRPFRAGARRRSPSAGRAGTWISARASG